MTPLRILAGSAGLALVGGIALAGLLSHTPPQVGAASHDGWNDVPWSMPRDQWGEGLAFRCASPECGGEMTVHVRAKLGFCDCAQGIVDDDHLDRIGDADLLGASEPIAAGKRVTVRGMHGRMRHYARTGVGGPAASVLSIAINDRCDVIVATALASDPREGAAQAQAVLALMSGATVFRWATSTLGL